MKRTFDIKFLIENDYETLEEAIGSILQQYGAKVRIQQIYDTRTASQNNAIHLFCKLLAEAFNERGLEVRVVLSEEIEHPWSTILVKELIWRPIQQSYIGKTSTTKLDKVKEINNIVDVINRFVGEKWGIFVPFPSIEYQRTKGQG